MRWIICVTIGLCFAATLPVRAAMYAAGDEKNLWLVTQQIDKESESPEVAISVRPNKGDDHALTALGKRHGRIKPHGVAAAQGRLWLIYTNGTVQSLVHLSDAPPMSLPYRDTIETPLPISRPQIVSLVADQRGLWLLAKVNDADDLKAIDNLHASNDQSDTTAADEKKDAADSPTDALDAENKTEAESDAAAAPVLPQHRLLRLNGQRWSQVDLPKVLADLINGSSMIKLLVRDPQSGAVSLVVTTPRANDTDVTEFRLLDDNWQETRHTLPTLSPLKAAVVDRQLILAYEVVADAADMNDTQAAAGRSISLHLLLPNQVTTLAAVPYDPQAGESWELLTDRSRLAILTWKQSANTANALIWVDLQGNVTGPTPLETIKPKPWRQNFDQLVLIGVIAAATIIMFAFWRRDPNWNQLTLPGDLAVADLGRRAAAGLIDLVPCILIVFFFYEIPLAQLHHHWPGQITDGWQDMIPGSVTIAVYVSYCTLCELFTGKTLGKKALGLQVTTLAGKPPNIWQVLARNFIKIFELIAFFLLLLPILVPNHQRLGDLVGRTVVVGKAGPPPVKKPVQDDDNNWP